MARRTPPSRLIGSGLVPQSYQDEYNNAQNDYETGLAGVGRDQNTLFHDYGFQGGINEQGAVDFSVDPNNRFGAYQKLIQSIGQQLAAARQETSGRGIGKRGLAKARESLIRDMSAGDKSSLVNQFSKGAANIFGQRGSLLGSRNRAFTGIEGQALDWWNQYGPEDPNATTDAGTGSGVTTSGSQSGSGGYTPVDPWQEQTQMPQVQSDLSEYYKSGGVGGGGIPTDYTPMYGAPKLPPSALSTPATTLYKPRSRTGFQPY